MKKKVKDLDDICSSRAPEEWRQFPEIKMAKPKPFNREISLQKLDGMNICYWSTGWGGRWTRASNFFLIRYKKCYVLPG